jgi:hypothetical protein
LEVVVNASPTLFSRHAPLLLELASVEEVLVNSSPSLFCLCRAERGARRIAAQYSTLLLELASTPAKLVQGKTKKPRPGCGQGNKKPPRGCLGGWV